MSRPVIPPLNYGRVAKGVLRSGYPNYKNFPFLATLKLKSVVYLSQVPLLPEYERFLSEHGISLFTVKGHDGLRTHPPFELVSEQAVASVLRHLLDERNRPVLVHDEKGKHRVGVVVGCLRKLQRWSLTSIFDEYRRFCGKIRALDAQFIELFSMSESVARTEKLVCGGSAMLDDGDDGEPKE
jgi:tyrosine-protein phosphatase SIW14